MQHKWRLADYDKPQAGPFVEEDSYLVFVEDEIYKDEKGNPIFTSKSLAKPSEHTMKSKSVLKEELIIILNM